MHGFIDAINGGHVVGWVKLKNHEHSIAIDLLVNGDPVAIKHPANILRPDVQAAGIGHGRYGFSIPIPEIYLQEDEIEITLQSSEWANSPISIMLSTDNIEFDNDNAKKNEYIFSNIDKKSDIFLHIDEISHSLVRGWCVDRNDIDKIIDIDVLIDGMLFANARSDRPRGDLKNKNISNGLGGFNAPLPLSWMGAGEHIVSLRTPDGKVTEKTVAITPQPERLNYSLVAQPIQRLSVVIPVFNAADDVEICIQRLAEFTSPEVNILFIDDASTDARIPELLKKAADQPNMRYLRNKKNMGFTRTVNRGLAETGNDDVIILNSDARVTPGWVEGMMLAARSGPRIATVTAMSDRAGAFSAPRIGNDNVLPEGLSEIAYARAFRRHSLGLYPAVPTGNGFCMFISRECMNEIGVLDAEAFPRGYGEENDFCMRAMRAGWHNIIDDRTYVFHDRSKSFGDAKSDLMAAGRAVVDSRYPEYRKAIGVFSTDEKIGMARFRAQAALAACQAKPLAPLRILFVVSTQTGGTPQTNRDLMQGLSGDVDGWILRCDSAILELSRMIDGETQVVRTHHLDEAVNPISHRSNEYDAVVSQWLLGLDPDIVHIRHLGWHGLSLPRIVKNLGKKAIFSFHDYYALCPTVKLLDENNRFCGGTCTKSDGQCRAELWPEGSLPELKGKWVHVWRERFAEALEPCDAFITTSDSARSRLLQHMPSLPADRFLVIPHGRDFEFSRVSQPPLPGEPLRILVPGNISQAKGLDVIHDLLEEDKAGLLEFHVLGAIAASERGDHPRLIRHGTYQRENFAEKAGPIRPHIGAILSVWDETYCHTLTELWSVGLPAIAFDYATVADRIRQSGAGWVMKHEDIPALYREFLRVGFDHDERFRIDRALIAWQEDEGTRNTIRVMAASYLAIYRDVLRDTPGVPGSGTQAQVAVVCPASGDLQQANASTYIRIWERTRNRIDRDISYIPMTAATLLANLKAGTVSGAIIQNTAIPSALSAPLLAALKTTDTPYLFDLDDDLLHVPPAKDPVGFYANYAPLLKDMLSSASVVTVSTKTLQDSMQAFNDNVLFLPNRFSDRLWKGISASPASTVAGPMHAVYMGPHTHEHDLQMILPALDAVADIYPNFRLSLIDIASSETISAGRNWLTRIEVPEEAKAYDKFVPWLQDLSKTFNFGIVPLAEMDSNCSKSALKILDYAAMGLPVIASDFENSRNLAVNAPAVQLIENNLEAWRAALLSQIELGSENASLGKQMRQWILQNHMLEQSLPAFDELVLSMLPRSDEKRSSSSSSQRKNVSFDTLKGVLRFQRRTLGH